MLAPTFWDVLSSWSIGLHVLVFALGGMLLLLTLGTAPRVELRPHVVRAARWIPVTALAWCRSATSTLRELSPVGCVSRHVVTVWG